MKSIVLLFFLGFTIIILSQEPGANQDFGKYHKEISYDTNYVVDAPFRLTLSNPLKKLPSDKTWILFKDVGSDYKTIQNLTIHKSKTFKGDTTSVSIKGEYIEHISNPYYSEIVPVSFYSDFITNQDWSVFKKYVRDSIARRFISEEFGADEWLIKTYTEELQVLDRSEWNINWEPKLDYQKYQTNELYPYLSMLNYSESQRYYRKVQLDSRKLNYIYYWIDAEGIAKRKKELGLLPNAHVQKRRMHINYSDYIVYERVNLFRDSTLWVKDTSLNHFSNVEDGLCQFYNYHSYFENEALTGVNAPQAKAFLKWCEINHQKYLNQKGLELKVVYSLPNYKVNRFENPNAITVASFSLASWKITNTDYEKFVEYTRDSIALRILAEEHGAANFLLPYLDDELQEKDESEWPLNWKAKIDWANKTGKPFKYNKRKYFPPYGLLNPMFYSPSEGDTNLLDKRKLMLEQYYYDFKTAAITVDREPTNDYYEGCDVCNEKTYLERGKKNSNCLRGEMNDPPIYLGKDLSLSHLNKFYQATDVHAHEDRSRFIIRDLINVYPGINYKNVTTNCIHGCFDLGEQDIHGKELCKYIDCNLCPQDIDWDAIPEEYDFKSEPDALIQNITYLQFLAYWRWRIEKRTLPNENENPVISHYIPSEDEFLKIQKGMDVSHPEEVHELPTPAFRYVVKFYPKG